MTNADTRGDVERPPIIDPKPPIPGAPLAKAGVAKKVGAKIVGGETIVTASTMNAALGGFTPHWEGIAGPLSRDERLAKHHAAAVKLRAKARRSPKKGRMVKGGREGRKVN